MILKRDPSISLSFKDKYLVCDDKKCFEFHNSFWTKSVVVGKNGIFAFQIFFYCINKDTNTTNSGNNRPIIVEKK